jgi:hypothetical protein
MSYNIGSNIKMQKSQNNDITASLSLPAAKSKATNSDRGLFDIFVGLAGGLGKGRLEQYQRLKIKSKNRK